MKPLQIYLQFDGQCAEALRWYETALGAKVIATMPYRGSPMETQAPKEWLDRVMHAELELGGTAIMACDRMPGLPPAPMQGFSLSLHAPDGAAGKALFDTLAAGGSVSMPFGPVFWGGQFGMATDRFGTPWMVSSAT